MIYLGTFKVHIYSKSVDAILPKIRQPLELLAHAVCDAEEYLQGSYEWFTLSSCPGMTISSFAMVVRGEGVLDLTS